ncbi:MAG TPA: hypothetical protein DCP92_01420 [Nitrospiraceae bacterium]|nr:hypothetical protein [Nitrospiraceae bacterium]
MLIGKLAYATTVDYNVNYHIVWSVSYRRNALTGDSGERLKQLLYDIAAQKGYYPIDGSSVKSCARICLRLTEIFRSYN